MQDHVLKFAASPQHPAGCIKRGHVRRLILWAIDGDRCRAALTIQCRLNGGIGDRILTEHAIQWRQADPLPHDLFAVFGKLCRACLNRGVEFRIWDKLVDQPPLLGPFAAHAFLCGTEHIRPVAPHFSFVRHPRQPAGPRQHSQQRHLGQRNRRRAVIGQHDMIACKRQFIPAPGTRTFYDGHVFLTAIRFGSLKGIAGFIGEFAEIDLMAVFRTPQHPNIRPSTEHAVFARLHDNDFNLRMLKPHTLHDIVQFDIHAQVI